MGNKQATDQIINLIPNLNQADGWQILRALEAQFNWCGTMFCIEDVESLVERDLTPDEREEVTRSWFWRKGMLEHMGNAGNELLFDLISELGLDEEDEDDPMAQVGNQLVAGTHWNLGNEDKS